MSHPSPQKNGGNNVPPPRQIRFVSTDGQPQTKRRRVNAAEPSAHARSQSDAASRTPTIAPLPTPGDATALRAARKAASRSPSSPRRTIVPITDGVDKPSEALKPLEPKEEPLPIDTSSRTTKEFEQPNNGASPESSTLLGLFWLLECLVWVAMAHQALYRLGRTSLSSSARTHVPYFRYFGPTAIVPGFKQMVVQVRGSRKSNPSLSSGLHS
ncbi:hypothetical protein AAWM_08954 [Aspergillus awamori]|uniref:Uncharacterized protein n=1 Tax=Aspergillus awamori TaxID=105351 RepID=A0A401L3H8_ASPAW|nr:hypothetical protein AAWM_08954 [Aspergillus awamori]